MKSLSIALLMAVAVACVAYVCAAPPADITDQVREGLGSAFKRGMEAFGEPQKVLNPVQKELEGLRSTIGSAYLRGVDMFDMNKANNTIFQRAASRLQTAPAARR